MYVAFLPSALLAKQESYYFADVIARSLRIVGVEPDTIARLILGAGANAVVSMPWTLDLATFFFFASLILIAAIILSYPLSIISSGYTILYVILRKKISGENMLEVKEEEPKAGVEEAAKEPKKKTGENN